MILTEPFILSFYDTLKQKAQRAIKRRSFDSALHYLEAAENTAYKFYLCHTDSDIEQMHTEIATHLTTVTDFAPVEGRVVMVDTFSQDAQGLTMQYLDAIIAAGWDLLYITTFGLDDSRSVKLKQTLEAYPKAQVLTAPRLSSYMKRCQWIYDAIVEFAPQHLFAHIDPSAVIPVTVLYALPRAIKRFQINLTDHTYWVGAGCMDYSFEFRTYGASLSVVHRGLSEEQILLQPYYPVMRKTAFDGFPKEVEGKVKIFAGSSYYKIIDSRDSFFLLSKAILDANPSAVILFAGGGNRNILDSRIEKYGLQGRFIPIGQRGDIFQCYLHSDIYLSTFPKFGALMAQFAAHASLPVLALAEKDSGRVEEVICQKQQETISFSTIDDLVSESRRLVDDVDYRRAKGEKVHSMVMGVNEFNHSFRKAVDTCHSQYPFIIERPVTLHPLDREGKILLENSTGSYVQCVFSNLGPRLLTISPSLFFAGLKARIKSSRFFS